jgi:hypothetical protein
MTEDKYQLSSSDRANGTRLIPPLILVGRIIAGGPLFAAYYGGQAAPTVA